MEEEKRRTWDVRRKGRREFWTECTECYKMEEAGGRIHYEDRSTKGRKSLSTDHTEFTDESFPSVLALHSRLGDAGSPVSSTDKSGMWAQFTEEEFWTECGEKDEG